MHFPESSKNLWRVINEYKSDLLPEDPKDAYSAYSPELGLADAQFKELLDGLPAGFAFIFQGLFVKDSAYTPIYWFSWLITYI